LVKRGGRQPGLSQARPHVPCAIGVAEDGVAIQGLPSPTASTNHASPCPPFAPRGGEEGRRGERVAWLALHWEAGVQPSTATPTINGNISSLSWWVIWLGRWSLAGHVEGHDEKKRRLAAHVSHRERRRMMNLAHAASRIEGLWARTSAAQGRGLASFVRVCVLVHAAGTREGKTFVTHPRLHLSLLTLPSSSHRYTNNRPWPPRTSKPLLSTGTPKQRRAWQAPGWTPCHARPGPRRTHTTTSHSPPSSYPHAPQNDSPRPAPCLKQRDARNSLPHPLPTRRTAQRPPPSPIPMARLLLLKAPPLLRLMPVPPLPARPLRARSTYNHLTSPPSPPSPPSLPSSYFMHEPLFRTQRAFPSACRTTQQHHTYTPTHSQTA